jgi:hypothetical protein
MKAVSLFYITPYLNALMLNSFVTDGGVLYLNFLLFPVAFILFIL